MTYFLNMKNINLSLLTGFLLADFMLKPRSNYPEFLGITWLFSGDGQLPVWGWSSPNEKMVLTFNQQKKETIADKNGKWRHKLDPEPAGGPFELKVQGRNQFDIS